MNRPYVLQDGRITRSNLSLSSFNLRRLLLVAIAFIILFFTNPGNDKENVLSTFFSRIHIPISQNGRNNSRQTKSNISSSASNRRARRNLIGSVAWELFGIEIDIFTSAEQERKWPSCTKTSFQTNYVVFSLLRRPAGIDIALLSKEYPLCYFDGSTPLLCEWIADNLCHGMKAFDPKNRPFTALRLIETMKIVSYVLNLCTINGSHWCPPASTSSTIHNPLSPFLSVLHQPYWYSDLISLNMFVYPALKILDRVVSLGTSNADTAFWHFYMSAFILICIIGGLSNLASSFVVDQKVHGMKGSIAASLGYILAIAPKKVLSDWMDIQTNANDILFGVFIIALGSSIFGPFPGSGNWRICEAAAWGFGGLAGNIFGKYQVEKYGIGWIPLW